eukprot:g8634.t1
MQNGGAASNSKVEGGPNVEAVVAVFHDLWHESVWDQTAKLFGAIDSCSEQALQLRKLMKGLGESRTSGAKHLFMLVKALDGEDKWREPETAATAELQRAESTLLDVLSAQAIGMSETANELFTHAETIMSNTVQWKQHKAKLAKEEQNFKKQATSSRKELRKQEKVALKVWGLLQMADSKAQQNPKKAKEVEKYRVKAVKEFHRYEQLQYTADQLSSRFAAWMCELRGWHQSLLVSLHASYSLFAQLEHDRFLAPITAKSSKLARGLSAEVAGDHLTTLQAQLQKQTELTAKVAKRPHLQRLLLPPALPCTADALEARASSLGAMLALDQHQAVSNHSEEQAKLAQQDDCLPELLRLAGDFKASQEQLAAMRDSLKEEIQANQARREVGLAAFKRQARSTIFLSFRNSSGTPLDHSASALPRGSDPSHYASSLTSHSASPSLTHSSRVPSSESVASLLGSSSSYSVNASEQQGVPRRGSFSQDGDDNVSSAPSTPISSSHSRQSSSSVPNRQKPTVAPLSASAKGDPSSPLPSQPSTSPRSGPPAPLHHSQSETGIGGPRITPRVGLTTHNKAKVNRNSQTLTASQVKALEKASEDSQEERQKEAEERKEKWKGYSAEEKAKQAALGHKVAQELLETEETYVRCLATLCELFVVPLQTQFGEGIGLSPEQIGKLVSNLETLHKFHEALIKTLHKFHEALIKDLREKSAHPAAVLLQYGDFFKLYISYLNNYTETLDVINALRVKKKFQDFLANLRLKLLKLPGSLDLMSYMIMPVQRVPRYLLLLKELKERTDPATAEFAEIQEALAKVRVATAMINEGKRQMESMSRLLEVQSRISDLPEDLSLMAPSRRLLREGPIQEHRTAGVLGSIKPHARIFFLFNDIVLWTNEKFKFKGYLQLAPLSVEEQMAQMILLYNTQTSVSLRAKDDEEQRSWVVDLRQAIESAKDNIHNRRGILKEGKMRNMRNYERASERHSMLVQGLTEIAVAKVVDENKPRNSPGIAQEQSSEPSSPTSPTGKFKPRYVQGRREINRADPG